MKNPVSGLKLTLYPKRERPLKEIVDKMTGRPIKKTYSFDVDECGACPFFTLKWKVSERHQIRNRATIPCYVCDHPHVFMLQLPNVIRVEGEPVNLKENHRTWNYPDPNGVPIPKWCPLDDYKDPGVKTSITSIVVKDGKVLLGLREEGCETAKNEWAYPGGRMDYGEDPPTGITREIKEETTLDIVTENIEFLVWMNEFFPEENKHYVSLVFLIKDFEGEPKVTEPDKCKKWEWFDPDDIPKNTFWACKENIEKFKDRIKNPDS